MSNFRDGFQEITTPSVLVSSSAKDLGFENLSSFCTDDYNGAREAVQLLVDTGRKHFLVIGGFYSEEEEQVSTRRLKGALSVLKENGIRFRMDQRYLESVFSFEDGYQKTKKALESRMKVDAIFALSDMIGIGVLRACHDCGKRVPDDISVIGFDGIEYTDYTVPRLATIRQSTDRLAALSVRDLINRINDPRTASVHEFVPFLVMAKESIKV